MPLDQWREVNAAFSRQSSHFDEDDLANPILQQWRVRIYQHIQKFIKPNATILELNSGTGIDAVYFARQGHQVHATDLSDGMIAAIQKKRDRFSLQEKISVQQVSFEQLDSVKGKFDYVFSNFGGLNCTDDLTKVTRHLSSVLNENAFVTWVIMPRVCPWEWLWLLKGKFKMALRRFNRSGAASQLEGHHFLSYYFSLAQIKKSLPSGVEIVKVESLGCLSPPPSATDFVKSFPRLTNFLNRVDQLVSNKFPFYRWGDHLVVTFGLVTKRDGVKA